MCIRDSIRTGQDIVKCAALGADLVGLASPFLKAAMESAEAVVEEMEILTAEAVSYTHLTLPTSDLV